MTCRTPTLSFIAAALALGAATTASVGAQQPTPPLPSPTPSSGSPSALAPYRAPTIALVQPPGGGTVPLDRPVVVFRFAAGEPNDPLDLGSFLVAVDGIDRTTLFQTTAAEAWGPLAEAETIRRRAFAAGPHRVTARICSSRGACSTADAQLLADAGPLATGAPSLTRVAPPDSIRPSTIRRLAGALIGIGRKLLIP